MLITYATEPTPGLPNEDYIVSGPTWVAVLDGATAPPRVDSGCVHTVRWLVHQLGAELARRLVLDTDRPLADLLAGAIGATKQAHADTCDLTNPSSPSSTVAILRQRAGDLDYLALADSPIILDVDGEIRVVIDDRTAHLPDYSVPGVRAARNQPDGFWVASTDTAAAAEALTGSVPTTAVRRAAVLTDGASRYVERFSLGKWRDLLELLEQHGPQELIRQVRLAECAETETERVGRRGKIHDDATAALISMTTRG